MEIDIDGEEADVVELAPAPVQVSQPIDIIWDDDKIEKVSLDDNTIPYDFVHFLVLTKNTAVY